MTETKTYNGWTNYETWNVALWIDNEQGSYNEWRERAQECLDAARPRSGWTRKEAAALELSRCLKEHIEEDMQTWLEDKPACMFADLLGAAVSEVNWHEIATSWLDDMEPTEPEED